MVESHYRGLTCSAWLATKSLVIFLLFLRSCVANIMTSTDALSDNAKHMQVEAHSYSSFSEGIQDDGLEFFLDFGLDAEAVMRLMLIMWLSVRN